MRILWCHEVSYAEKPVYEYQDFAERLAARGHDVEVIDFVEGAATTSGSACISRTGEAEVTLSSIPHSGLPLVKYVEARLRFRQMLEERIATGALDAVFVYSVFINGTEAVTLCRKAGIPVVYRAIDAYHRLRPGKLAQALLLSGERYIYRNANQVITTNEEMSAYVADVAGRDLIAPPVVLDHGVDENHFSPRSRDVELMTRYGITEADLVAVFLGTTYAFSGLVNLVRRMPDLLAAFPNLKLMIVGAGEQDEELAALVESLGLTGRVILTGMIDYLYVPRHLSLGAVALNPFEINEITRDIVPIKILQYQAMGLPVVSTPLPDLQRKHPPGVSGVVYSKDDGITSFIHRLGEVLKSGSLSETGTLGRHYMETSFTVGAAIDKLERMLETMVKVPREAPNHA